MSTIREQLMRFIELLRGRGVRISVAETMDAMRAIVAAGFERAVMREALATTLIKDEGDRLIFDEAFGAFFRAPATERGEVRGASSYQSAQGRSRGAEGTPEIPRKEQPDREKQGKRIPRGREEKSGRLRGKEEAVARDERMPARDRSSADREGEISAEADTESSGGPSSSPSPGHGKGDGTLRAAERKAFAEYSDFDYEAARDALKPLIRRFRVRAGRRFKIAGRERIDFRRTIRAATSRGGKMIELRFRSRRPRHIDLLILADISGSVRYCSALLLEIVAGARQCFRRVRSFVYIDRLAEAEFEQGHLVMTPALDLYERSDFGRVLAELWHRRDDLIGRATVLVILGDARNNRRPARADLLREIEKACRAVIWLNPEEPERWGTGDSAIRLYEREVDLLLPSRNLRELESGIARAG